MNGKVVLALSLVVAAASGCKKNNPQATQGYDNQTRATTTDTGAVSTINNETPAGTNVNTTTGRNTTTGTMNANDLPGADKTKPGSGTVPVGQSATGSKGDKRTGQ